MNAQLAILLLLLALASSQDNVGGAEIAGLEKFVALTALSNNLQRTSLKVGEWYEVQGKITGFRAATPDEERLLMQYASASTETVRIEALAVQPMAITIKHSITEAGRSQTTNLSCERSIYCLQLAMMSHDFSYESEAKLTDLKYLGKERLSVVGKPVSAQKFSFGVANTSRRDNKLTKIRHEGTIWLCTELPLDGFCKASLVTTSERDGNKLVVEHTRTLTRYGFSQP